MIIPHFITIPKSNDFKIPFKLKEDFLLTWLLGLSEYSKEQACSSIRQFLQALNEVELAAKTRIDFLKISHEYFKQYVNQLEGSCWDAKLPLSAKEKIYANTVIWHYLTLAESFFIAAQDSSAKAEKLFSLYMACHSLGQAQLHTAAVYRKLDEGFWSLIYQVFSRAEKYKLLDTEINNSDLKGVTLQILFAQIFIFHNCHTNQFHPRDMRTIFNFLPKVCVDLGIYKLSDIQFQTEILNIQYRHALVNSFSNLSEKLTETIQARKDLFVFDLEYNIAPALFNSSYLLTKPSLRYFTAAPVAENLEKIIKQGKMWTGVLKSINHELFSRVIKTLEPGRKRKHARSQANYTLLGVVGFENIISFLYKVNRKSIVDNQPNFPHLKTPAYEKLKSSSHKAHVQMGAIDGGFAEIDFTYPVSKNNAGENKKNIDEENKNSTESPDKPVSLKKMNIFDSSMCGYSIYWSDENSKTKIGDIFGIISQDKKRLEIAIIRRIAIVDKENYKFGGEILGFDSEAVIITYKKDESVGGWSIFIPGNEALKQTDSVIYHTGNFQLNDAIYIYRQSKKVLATLKKELNTTSAITHAEVSYLPS